MVTDTHPDSPLPPAMIVPRLLFAVLALTPPACGNRDAQPPDPAGAPSTGSVSASPAGNSLRPNAPLSKVLAKADPSGDPEWTTEQFNEDAGARLGKVLMPYIESSDADVPADLLAAGFKCTALRPELQSTFKDKAFAVLRPVALSPEFSFSGPNGFRDALAPMKAALAKSNEHFHGKAKIVRVEAGSADKPWSTLVYFEANRGPIQQNAEWQCTWLSGTDPVQAAPRVDLTPPLRGNPCVRRHARHSGSFRGLHRGCPCSQPVLEGATGLSAPRTGTATSMSRSAFIRATRASRSPTPTATDSKMSTSASPTDSQIDSSSKSQTER